MIKSIALAQRKTGTTREEYNRYWLEQHAPLAARMIPGLRRYVQNHLVSVPGRQYEGDGIVEMWYDDLAAFDKSMQFILSDAGKAPREDAQKFAEMRGGGGFWLVEEHVILDETGNKDRSVPG